MLDRKRSCSSHGKSAVLGTLFSVTSTVSHAVLDQTLICLLHVIESFGSILQYCKTALQSLWTWNWPFSVPVDELLFSFFFIHTVLWPCVTDFCYFKHSMWHETLWRNDGEFRDKEGDVGYVISRCCTVKLDTSVYSQRCNESQLLAGEWVRHLSEGKMTAVSRWSSEAPLTFMLNLLWEARETLSLGILREASTKVQFLACT